MHITCNRYGKFCIVTSCNIEIWNKNNIEKLFVISKLLLLLFNISSNLGAMGQHMTVNSMTMDLITARGHYRHLVGNLSVLILNLSYNITHYLYIQTCHKKIILSLSFHYFYK